MPGAGAWLPHLGAWQCLSWQGRGVLGRPAQRLSWADPNSDLMPKCQAALHQGRISIKDTGAATVQAWEGVCAPEPCSEVKGKGRECQWEP